jgi:hypothetical protein
MSDNDASVIEAGAVLRSSLRQLAESRERLHLAQQDVEMAREEVHADRRLSPKIAMLMPWESHRSMRYNAHKIPGHGARQ